jgi:bHLH factor
MNQSFMQSQMSSTHQTVGQQVTNQSSSQQAVQFQTLQTYNTSILHPQPTRNIHTPKPPVGSDEWLKQRRANHKEVERRRREIINEGINELAKLIPEDEKNKGRIIARAVQYIQRLKEQESTNLEKWTLEKLLCEQAISELSLQVETLKHQNSQLKAQLAALTQQLQPQYQTATATATAANSTAQNTTTQTNQNIQVQNKIQVTNQTQIQSNTSANTQAVQESQSKVGTVAKIEKEKE